jgi:hypothetical protein
MRSLVRGRLTVFACVLMLSIAALPVLAEAQPASPVQAKASGLPKAPSLTGSLKVKPTSMQIVAVGHLGEAPKLPTIIGGKQSGKHTANLHWKKWNQTKAIAEAYVYEGTQPGYASTVTLSNPKSIDGQLVFTHLASCGGKSVTATISHQSIPGSGDLQWAPAGS